MLYGSFVQDCVEFLMTIVIPVNKQHVLKSYKDLIDIKEDHLKELREWLDPLMKASLFMHYFNNEIDYLPHDLLQEIHSQTRLSGHLALDHILSLDHVPRDPVLYPKEWLRSQIVALCKKHHARLLNPLRDIYFEETTYASLAGNSIIEDKKVGASAAKQGAGAQQPEDAAQDKAKSRDAAGSGAGGVPGYRIVVVLDGWDHMAPVPEEIMMDGEGCRVAEIE